MKIALQTLFLPRMELLYISEWLDYHIAIGVDHFYLYNNGYRASGRCIMQGSHPVDEVKSDELRTEPVWVKRADMDWMLNTSKEDIADQLNAILKPYIDSGYVTLIDWFIPYYREGVHMKQRKCSLIGTQREAMEHCLYTYGIDNYEWVGCTDIDEFMFLPNVDTLKDALQCPDSVGCITPRQKLFSSRFNDDGPISIFDNIRGGWQVPDGKLSKNIVRTSPHAFFKKKIHTTKLRANYTQHTSTDIILHHYRGMGTPASPGATVSVQHESTHGKGGWQTIIKKLMIVF